jgi:hypothetical protein
MQIRPGPPQHPLRYFHGEGVFIRRLCQTSLCVNPHHFSTSPKQPSLPLQPLIIEAEEELEKLSPNVTLWDALRATSGIVPPHYLLYAYRNMRELKQPRRNSSG